MRLRWFFVASIVTPAVLQVACSASNGESIPGEVHDASALDVSTNEPPGRDSSTGGEEEQEAGTPPKDGATNDAPADAPPDAPATSAAVRINEVYVDRSGDGARVEYVEVRGPAGVDITDLAIRVINASGTPTSTTPYSIAPVPGTKMPASGLWVIGGFLANTDTIVSVPQGWDLATKGAVQLLRGTTLIDVVGWTTDADGGTVPQPSTDPKSTGEGKPYVLPAAGTKSFGRAAAFADTNDNKADFCTMAQSAKAANAACE